MPAEIISHGVLYTQKVRSWEEYLVTMHQLQSFIPSAQSEEVCALHPDWCRTCRPHCHDLDGFGLDQWQKWKQADFPQLQNVDMQKTLLWKPFALDDASANMLSPSQKTWVWNDDGSWSSWKEENSCTDFEGVLPPTEQVQNPMRNGDLSVETAYWVVDCLEPFLETLESNLACWIMKTHAAISPDSWRQFLDEILAIRFCRFTNLSTAVTTLRGSYEICWTWIKMIFLRLIWRP